MQKQYDRSRQRHLTALITGVEAEMGERRSVGVKESSKQTEVRQVWKDPRENSAPLQKEMEEGPGTANRGEDEEKKLTQSDEVCKTPGSNQDRGNMHMDLETTRITFRILSEGKLKFYE